MRGRPECAPDRLREQELPGGERLAGLGDDAHAVAAPVRRTRDVAVADVDAERERVRHRAEAGRGHAVAALVRERPVRLRRGAKRAVHDVEVPAREAAVVLSTCA
jgi:hypothetical protein